MHPSSMENMRKAKKYMKNLGKDLIVLDVGGRSLDIKVKNRSYQEIFEDVAKDFYIADICDGPGVTHVMPGPYTLPFDNDSIDLVVSGQTLEHVKNPFRSVAEMFRVLKPGGYIALIAPSSGPKHDNPDCWRIMDDGFKAIAEEVGIAVIADWVDRSAPDDRSRKWQDHVFVGYKE